MDTISYLFERLILAARHMVWMICVRLVGMLSSPSTRERKLFSMQNYARLFLMIEGEHVRHSDTARCLIFPFPCDASACALMSGWIRSRAFRHTRKISRGTTDRSSNLTCDMPLDGFVSLPCVQSENVGPLPSLNMLLCCTILMREKGRPRRRRMINQREQTEKEVHRT